MENPKKATILLVDDEEDILKVIGKRLESEGYAVLTAPGGEPALKILEKEIPDLIILDIMMPDINGIEVCHRIKKMKHLANVPVVFFTAKDSVEDKIQGYKQGVYDYITKPIEHRELSARIDSVLRIDRYCKDVSLKDDLTGLYNYKFFQIQFGHTFDLCKRYSRVFSLVIIDVDNFKHVNDTCGHLCGNMLLEKISEKLKGSLRIVDVITRYGGDEFALILPETDNEKAKIVLDRLKKETGNIIFEYGGERIEAGLSFGLSTYSKDIDTKEAMFDIADKDMYAQKKEKNKEKYIPEFFLDK